MLLLRPGSSFSAAAAVAVSVLLRFLFTQAGLASCAGVLCRIGQHYKGKSGLVYATVSVDV